MRQCENMKDGFGRNIHYLRLSVTDLCNLRCRYCMPVEGVCRLKHGEILSQEEMLRAVRLGAEMGIDKVRITGGEPLVKRNILSICEGIAATPGIRETGITTNATRLKEMAPAVRKAGIGRVNISLDTLKPEKYTYITRGGDLRGALEGIEAALTAGFERVKINTVLIGGFNDGEIPDLADLARKWPVDVRFIELMPMAGNREFGPECYIPVSRVLESLPDATETEEEGVARLYRLPGAPGRIGLISPLSRHFCGSCDRIRLTADGKLKPCLHSGEEISIRGLTEEEVREKMRQAILSKPACHGALTPEERSRAGRDMNQIGG